MNDKIERLLQFDDHKLIDVVKNYRLYGYDDSIRSTAMSILEQRGITVEYLELTGNLKNRNFEEAKVCYRSFQKNSVLALLTFLTMLIMQTVFIVLLRNNSSYPTLATVLFICTTVVYLFFLFRSFMAQQRFYRLMGDEYGAGGISIYLFMGIPLYAMMFFYFRNQMSDKMREIK